VPNKKKEATKAIDPKKAVCKQVGCFDEASAKGLCRLHFMRVLAGKGQGNGKARGKLKPVRDRRVRSRNTGIEDAIAPLDVADLTQEMDLLNELDRPEGTISEQEAFYLAEISEYKKTG